MNRARLTFYIVLAAVLGIVSISAALQLIVASALVPAFLATTIFSLGVVALDFLGILGGDESGEVDGLDVDSGFDSIESTDFDAIGDGGDGDFGDAGDVDGDIDTVDGDGNEGIDVFRADSDADGSSALSARDGGTLVLSVLLWLRMGVYFCLGFGPAGLASVVSGSSALVALLTAMPVGVASLLLAQWFFRFQRSNTDSSLRAVDMLQAPATVTIPLTHTTMGRVRVDVGMNVTEQYALAEFEDGDFHKGDEVRVVRVTDEAVYVA